MLTAPSVSIIEHEVPTQPKPAEKKTKVDEMKKMPKTMSDEVKQVVEDYNRILNNLLQFPNTKLKQVREKDFIKTKFADYVEGAEITFADNADFDLTKPNLFDPQILKNKELLSNFLRFQILNPKLTKPDLKLIDITLDQKLPPNVMKNPDAGNFFTVSQEEMQMMHESQVLTVNLKFGEYPAKIELEFLMAHEPYSARCVALFKEYLEEDVQNTKDDFQNYLDANDVEI